METPARLFRHVLQVGSVDLWQFTIQVDLPQENAPDTLVGIGFKKGTDVLEGDEGTFLKMGPGTDLQGKVLRVRPLTSEEMESSRPAQIFTGNG